MKFLCLILADHAELIEEIMKMIEDRTRIGNRNCITFKKQTTEKNYLKILNGVGCDSLIGKLKANQSQAVNLNRFTCMNQSTIAHELVHALGFDHEHNRPDRGNWVQINFDNVIDGVFNSDLRILNQTQYQDFGTPYDYKSIMHYHFNAHAINKSFPTIRAIKAPFDIEINENLSDFDVEEIRILYNFKPGISNLILIFRFDCKKKTFYRQ